MISATGFQIVPHPILSITIFVIWLLLWDAASLGLVAMGAFVAFVLPLFARRFWPDAPRVIKYRTLLVYTAVFVWDIIVANVNVAILILKPNSSLDPTFLEIPLDIDHPFLITILANTITLTPGTVSVNVAGNYETLLVHCLDCEDPDDEIAKIKSRYEDRLEDIFE
jgi:multicomponent K+:H+ antiporter subunit E